MSRKVSNINVSSGSLEDEEGTSIKAISIHSLTSPAGGAVTKAIERNQGIEDQTMDFRQVGSPGSQTDPSALFKVTILWTHVVDVTPNNF